MTSAFVQIAIMGGGGCYFTRFPLLRFSVQDVDVSIKPAGEKIGQGLRGNMVGSKTGIAHGPRSGRKSWKRVYRLERSYFSGHL